MATAQAKGLAAVPFSWTLMRLNLDKHAWLIGPNPAIALTAPAQKAAQPTPAPKAVQPPPEVQKKRRLSDMMI